MKFSTSLAIYYNQKEGGSIAQWLAYLLSDPATPGLIPCVPENVSKEKIINIAEFNHLRCLQESGLVALKMLIEPF